MFLTLKVLKIILKAHFRDLRTWQALAFLTNRVVSLMRIWTTIPSTGCNDSVISHALSVFVIFDLGRKSIGFKKFVYLDSVLSKLNEMRLISWVNEFRELILARRVCFNTRSRDIIIGRTIAQFAKLDTSGSIPEFSRIGILSPNPFEWASISLHSLSLSHIDCSRSSLGLEFPLSHLSKRHNALIFHVDRNLLIVVSSYWCNIV